jgi:ADP-ribose pyrophosphatase YjhB (NUDIX family)
MRKGFDFTGISVVAICHDGEGNYLLEHRSEKCRDEQLRWSPVGSGGLKVHESLEDGLRREIREECGAEAVDIMLLGHREVFREIDGEPYHWIAFDFKVLIDPLETSIIEPDKALEHRWFKLGDFPDPLHSQFPIFLDRYKDKL